MKNTAIKLSIDTNDVSSIQIEFRRNQLNVSLENEVGVFDEFELDEDLSDVEIEPDEDLLDKFESFEMDDDLSNEEDECIMDGEGGSVTPQTPKSERQEFIDSVIDEPETEAFFNDARDKGRFIRRLAEENL